jgi:hypothetical protein
MRVLELLGAGLGYDAWVRTSNYGVADQLLLPDGRLANCHPVITALPFHVDNIHGCAVGMLIAGVRWTEKYEGQEVANEVQAKEILSESSLDDQSLEDWYGALEDPQDPFNGGV